MLDRVLNTPLTMVTQIQNFEIQNFKSLLKNVRIYMKLKSTERINVDD